MDKIRLICNFFALSNSVLKSKNKIYDCPKQMELIYSDLIKQKFQNVRCNQNILNKAILKY